MEWTLIVRRCQIKYVTVGDLSFHPLQLLSDKLWENRGCPLQMMIMNPSSIRVAYVQDHFNIEDIFEEEIF